MTCIITKLEVENFMSFENVVIDFTKYNGITSITGINNDVPGAVNGTGKSTGPLALFYCLYGKSAVRMNNKFLFNRYTGETGFSISTTMIVDNVTFKVHRGANKGHASFLNLFKLVDSDTEEWHNISSSSIGETEQQIIKLLNGLTADLFLKTVFLTPTYGTNFFNMSRTVKNEFLNLISGTSKLQKVNLNVTKDINEVNTDIKIIDNELLSLARNNHELEVKRAEFLENRKEAVTNYNKSAAEIKTALETKAPEIASLTQSVRSLFDDLDKLKAQRTSRRNDIQNLQSVLVRLKAAKNSLELKNKHISESIDANQSLFSCLCEICKPKADEILHTPKLLEEKETNESTLQQIQKGTTQSSDSLLKLTEELKKVTTDISDAEELYKSAVSEKTKLEQEVSALEYKLHLLENNYNSTDTEPFSSMIESNNSRLENKHSEKTDKIKSRQQLSILKFATDSDTIHKFITSRFVKDINHYMTKFLNAMGVNYYCNFDDDLTYSFITPAGEMSYDNFSSGEKMRLNIAVSFALRQLLMAYINININIIILDEYLDSNLDALAIAGITSILSEIKEDPFYKVFLISHRSEFQSGNIDNFIVATKTNGITELSDVES